MPKIDVNVDQLSADAITHLGVQNQVELKKIITNALGERPRVSHIDGFTNAIVGGVSEISAHDYIIPVTKNVNENDKTAGTPATNTLIKVDIRKEKLPLSEIKRTATSLFEDFHDGTFTLSSLLSRTQTNHLNEPTKNADKEAFLYMTNVAAGVATNEGHALAVPQITNSIDLSLPELVYDQILNDIANLKDRTNVAAPFDNETEGWDDEEVVVWLHPFTVEALRKAKLLLTAGSQTKDVFEQAGIRAVHMIGNAPIIETVRMPQAIPGLNFIAYIVGTRGENASVAKKNEIKIFVQNQANNGNAVVVYADRRSGVEVVYPQSLFVGSVGIYVPTFIENKKKLGEKESWDKMNNLRKVHHYDQLSPADFPVFNTKKIAKK